MDNVESKKIIIIIMTTLCSNGIENVPLRIFIVIFFYYFVESFN